MYACADVSLSVSATYLCVQVAVPIDLNARASARSTDSALSPPMLVITSDTDTDNGASPEHSGQGSSSFPTGHTRSSSSHAKSFTPAFDNGSTGVDGDGGSATAGARRVKLRSAASPSSRGSASSSSSSESGSSSRAKGVRFAAEDDVHVYSMKLDDFTFETNLTKINQEVRRNYVSLALSQSLSERISYLCS